MKQEGYLRSIVDISKDALQHEIVKVIFSKIIIESDWNKCLQKQFKSDMVRPLPFLFNYVWSPPCLIEKRRSLLSFVDDLREKVHLIFQLCPAKYCSM